MAPKRKRGVRSPSPSPPPPSPQAAATEEHLTKDDARVFFNVRKIVDPTGQLPDRIALDIDRQGVHCFRLEPKEHFYTAEFTDLKEYGRSNTTVFFQIKVAGVLRIFHFETEQGEEICAAFQRHIDDVMVSRNSKAKSIEEAQSKIARITEELPEKQSQEVKLQEELERLKDSLRSEKQRSSEVAHDRDNLRSMCAQKDSALQTALLEKQNIEMRLASIGAEFNAKRDSQGANKQDRVIELEKKVEGLQKELDDAKSTLAIRNAELAALENNSKEFREMKEDVDRKNEQLAELEVRYKEEQVLRKRYFNTIEEMKGNIRVFCRLRPLSDREIAEKDRRVVTRTDEYTVEHPGKDGKAKQHTFHRVFDSNSTQEEVFEDTRNLIQFAVDGYNVCIFAYGQSGSGKTFTIWGSHDNPGLTPRATSELFQIIKRDSKKFKFSLKACMVELYQDTLVDLLLPENVKPAKLTLGSDSEGMVVVENATVFSFSKYEDLQSIIRKGLEKRHVAGTLMNRESSRSHFILSVVIESMNLHSQSVARGKLSFVNLALIPQCWLNRE